MRTRTLLILLLIVVLLITFGPALIAVASEMVAEAFGCQVDLNRVIPCEIDGKDYGAYQSLKGEYRYKDFSLYIDQIPKDPYAPPHTGRYRLVLKNNFTDKIGTLFDSKAAGIAFRDFLARRFFDMSLTMAKGRRGTGYSFTHWFLVRNAEYLAHFNETVRGNKCSQYGRND